MVPCRAVQAAVGEVIDPAFAYPAAQQVGAAVRKQRNGRSDVPYAPFSRRLAQITVDRLQQILEDIDQPVGIVRARQSPHPLDQHLARVFPCRMAAQSIGDQP